MDKKPYPFLPFEDSLVGEKILLVWQESNHSEKNLKDNLLKALDLTEDQIIFTPNAIKQKLMVSYPTEIRSYIEKGEPRNITNLLLQIARGKSELNPIPALDITFELMEWILTGFDLDDVLVETLSALFGTNLTNDFVDQVRAEYIKEFRG
ncbi:VanZ family protein [Leptospira noumeaensis]|uniref:VanZ family protein n=1 Tax=Leptospira noumeaensis TaxID=2484964 RepID=A0A4R9I9N8_9LEPT|nr:VanZ family protein [Leptospira noumeaensis]TGK83077.1 VanZ family protein [Leptospira noumeaensis]